MTKEQSDAEDTFVCVVDNIKMAKELERDVEVTSCHTEDDNDGEVDDESSSHNDDDDDVDDLEIFNGPREKYGCTKACFRDPHFKVTILSLSLIILGVMKLVCLLFSACLSGFFEEPAQTWFFVVYIFISLLYLREILCSHSFQYLCNQSSNEGLAEYLEKLYSAPPKVKWHIQCYHIEIRTKHYSRRDENGNWYHFTTTEEVRVNTHSARGWLVMTRFTDVSNRDKHNDMLEYQITKVSLKKSWCGDEGCQIQKAEFIRIHDRDVNFDFEETLEIPGFTPRKLAFTSKKPFFANWFFYLLCHITVVLALPYRMWLSSISGKVRHEICKEIYTD